MTWFNTSWYPPFSNLLMGSSNALPSSELQEVQHGTLYFEYKKPLKFGRVTSLLYKLNSFKIQSGITCSSLNWVFVGEIPQRKQQLPSTISRLNLFRLKKRNFPSSPIIDP
jgi:hypothetical protein